MTIITDELNARMVARQVYTVACSDPRTAPVAFALAVNVIQDLLKMSLKDAAQYVEEQIIPP